MHAFKYVSKDEKDLKEAESTPREGEFDPTRRTNGLLMERINVQTINNSHLLGQYFLAFCMKMKMQKIRYL